MNFVAHHDDETGKTYCKGEKPHPMYDDLDTFSYDQLANYADAKFKIDMQNTTPDDISRHYVGKFPNKPYREWSSVDVGRCACLIRQKNCPCTSYFEDELRNFISWYKRLDSINQKRMKDYDRDVCLLLHGYNAPVSKITAWEAFGIMYNMFSSFWNRF